MKVLVTGGSGMLGVALVRRLAARHDVTAVSKSGRGGEACDLSREEDLRGLWKGRTFELVIHAAAYSDVDGCEQDGRRAFESNALAPRNLARICAERWVPLVHVSTDYVFDGQKDRPYETDDPTFPVNVYGMTKLAGEHHVRAAGGVSAVVRTSWLFGPGNPRNFVNATRERLRKERTVRVLDDQEDSPTCVGDLSEALERIGEHLVDAAAGAKSNFEIFHFCNSGSTTRYGMTLKIREVLGLKGVEVARLGRSELGDRVAIRPARPVLSTCRYREVFKTSIRRWEEALGDYLTSGPK